MDHEYIHISKDDVITCQTAMNIHSGKDGHN